MDSINFIERILTNITGARISIIFTHNLIRRENKTTVDSNMPKLWNLSFHDPDSKFAKQWNSHLEDIDRSEGFSVSEGVALEFSKFLGQSLKLKGGK